MVLAKQDRENKRRKGVGNKERSQLKIDIPGRSLREDDLYGRKLNEQDPKDQRDAGVASKGLWLIDPELGDRGDKDEKTKQKLLRRFFLLAGKDQGGQTAHKASRKSGAGSAMHIRELP